MEIQQTFQKKNIDQSAFSQRGPALSRWVEPSLIVNYAGMYILANCKEQHTSVDDINSSRVSNNALRIVSPILLPAFNVIVLNAPSIVSLLNNNKNILTTFFLEVTNGYRTQKDVENKLWQKTSMFARSSMLMSFLFTLAKHSIIAYMINLNNFLNFVCNTMIQQNI